jgi:hypothetical protein
MRSNNFSRSLHIYNIRGTATAATPGKSLRPFSHGVPALAGWFRIAQGFENITAMNGVRPAAKAGTHAMGLAGK